MQQFIVSHHIDELRREGDALRLERTLRAARGDPRTVAGTGRASAARGRLGRWVVGVGQAIAGPASDQRGDTAGRPA